MTFTHPWFLLGLLSLGLIGWTAWQQRHVWQRRDWLSLLIRSVILTALTFALAGASFGAVTQRSAVVFLVDVSDSMSQATQAEAQAWVQAAIETMPVEDQAAIVLFGANALVERPMRNWETLDAFTSIPLQTETNLEQAIQLGLALLPSGYAQRLVILSDGIATNGATEDAALLALAADVRVDIVPFALSQQAETVVSSANAPERVRSGQQFELEVGITTNTAGPASVRVLSGDTVAYEGAVSLNVGANNFLLPLTATSTGFSQFRVQVDAAQDTILQNNALATYAQVLGPPRILVVSQLDEFGVDPSTQLLAALQEGGIDVEQVSPAALPADLTGLIEYASVVLVDTPARALSARQQLALQQYVRDLGGGLVAIGGPSSYGVGGWFRTPLEEMLPVEMQLTDEQRRPQVTMVFVVDRSGSMTDTSGGTNKLELAKEATIRAIELLSPNDRVGVIAFDDTAQWVVEMTDLTDADEVIARVGTLRAGGGTSILAGVQAMGQVLPAETGEIKHVILLTDGGADDSGLVRIIRNLNTEYGITLSSVGVGSGAAGFLPDLADAGDGRYHFTAQAESIPEIFSEETTLATRAYLIEEQFNPLQANSSDLLGGISAVPPLLGYVGTSAKTTANVVLVSDTAEGYNDPLLATWQYGLGRTVAWTSDATGRWATNWVQWPQYAQFWQQIVLGTVSNTLESDLTIDVVQDGTTATMTIDAVDLAGNYLNDLSLQANVVSPTGAQDIVTLQQIAPGQYQGAFTALEPGAYLLGISDQSGIGSYSQTAGWVLGYSNEYQLQTAETDTLTRVAGLTSGVQLASPAAAFEPFKTVRATAQPFWPQLLLLAILLWPLDIAIRRLYLTREDWLLFTQRFRRAETVPLESIPTTARVGSLQKAKARAATPVDTSVTPPPTVVEPVVPTKKAAAPATPEQPSGSTASQLLARKKKRSSDD